MKVTICLAILHCFIDFLCALTMFGRFAGWDNFIYSALLYNGFAFALQLPLGALLDDIIEKSGNQKVPTIVTIGSGIFLTAIGFYTNALVLGIGNALFHVGGGIASIQEDEVSHQKGKCLGVFVAPGALGLTIGSLLAGSLVQSVFVAAVACCTVLFGLFTRYYLNIDEMVATEESDKHLWKIVICCFLVVVIRSVVGLSVSFDWKTTTFLTILATLCVVGGKMLGGFLNVKFGFEKLVVVSLVIASIGYALSDNVVMGLVALLLFNMTMPLTLYRLFKAMPSSPGLAFGILTFALYVGYLLVHTGLFENISGSIIGVAGSLVSIALLLMVSEKHA